jgi:hypothetical protein
MNDIERTAKIRALNDLLRTTFSGGVVTITAGIDALPDYVKRLILQGAREFSEFDNENDVWEEGDFGAVEVNGYRAFFKLEYYDRSMECGSPDPADPSVTTRVLTIMLSDEY